MTTNDRADQNKILDRVSLLTELLQQEVLLDEFDFLLRNGI